MDRLSTSTQGSVREDLFDRTVLAVCSRDRTESPFLAAKRERDGLLKNTNMMTPLRVDEMLRSLTWFRCLQGTVGQPRGTQIIKGLDDMDEDSLLNLAQEWRTARRRYKELREKTLVTPQELARAEAANDDPLSQSADSVWQKLLTLKPLRAEINKDVLRTYAGDAYFSSEETQRMLNDQLLVFAAQEEHELLKYKQGMNELLAVCIYALRRDYEVMQQEPEMLEAFYPKFILDLLDPNELEADAYTLFSQVMELCWEWFSPTRPRTHAHTSVLFQKFHRVQHVLLKHLDLTLYQHLEGLQVPPQLYMLRWIRCLFTREFDLDDVVLIWDEILRHQDHMLAADYVCVALVMYHRYALLAEGRNILGVLMNLPRIQRVDVLLALARYLRGDVAPDFASLTPQQVESWKSGDLVPVLSQWPLVTRSISL
ncbi:MAG: hypothetical protein MHM6MM_006540 [Cercozoa sp. M6MM]